MYSSKKQKAQMSAPFELLVAIIVMTFVIIAGNYALSNLNENTCLGNKRQDFSNLSSSLREIVLGSDLAYRTIDFSTKACYNENYELVKLNIVSDDKERCERICGSGSSCVLLEYSYENTDKIDFKHPIPPICTYLPTNLQFEGENGCGILEDYEKVIDPTNSSTGIPSGRYKIFKKSGTEANHTICMIKTRWN